MKQHARRIFTRFQDRHVRRIEQHYSRVAKGASGAVAYDGLTPHSLAFASSRYASRSDRTVNIVLPEFSQGAYFAGIRTAIEFAVGIGERLGFNLRVIHFYGTLKPADRLQLESEIRRDFHVSAERHFSFVDGEHLDACEFSHEDVWIVTHWSTAHSVDVACKLGLIDKDRVVYLIQDYEPGFYAWSTTYALARSTYNAGFVCVANSMPVRDYLLRNERVRIPERYVFRPSLDLNRLRLAAEAGVSKGYTQITFYARPNKPRNMYKLGVSALQLAVSDLRRSGQETRVVTFGDVHPRLSGALKDAEIRGKMPWESYFEEVGRTDVLLSLQMSPHPSHPPLDAVVAGKVAVTNELDGARGGLHSRLHAVEPDPRSLADGIIDAVQSSAAGASSFSEDVLTSLGRDMHSVLEDVAESIG